MKNSLVFSLLCLLVACDSGTQETEPPAITQTVESAVVETSSNEAFNLTEIAEGFYVHQGVHLEVDHQDKAQVANIPNIGFIIGDKCVAVIDTGGSIAIGEKLRMAIKEKTQTPVCYVINSHVHFDHVLGNAAFKQDKPSYIGHINLADAIEQNREFFAENFGVDEIIGPDVLVEESMEVDLGNRVLLLTANPKAHTTTDLTILDEETNTLWLADLLFMERAPSLDGSLTGWYALMDELHDHDYAQVVPGHGPASAPWPAAMEPQQKYFKVLLDETRKAISDGVFLEDAVKTVGQSEKDNWILFESVHQRNVNRTYRELEWE